MIGFDGITAEQAPSNFIASLGGAILFRRNLQGAQQTRALVEGIQAAAKASGNAPLLIAIDQEGGTVSRLSGFGTTTPSAMALGAAGDELLSERVYEVIGAELRALGINLDFAPVADVNNNAGNPVVGVRSFGEDPSLVARHVSAAVRGLHAARVGATAKHFPGHGDTNVDSHVDLPSIDHSHHRLNEVELAPFRSAIAARIDAVMTAHVVFPAIEKEPIPATLSHAALTGLLRGELQYDGVICTDCMEMNAIAARYSAEGAVIMAVDAGADLVLFSQSLEKAQRAVNGLREAVMDGRLDAAQVERSLARIGALRERLGAVSDEPDIEVVGSIAHREIALEAARRALTLVRDPAGIVPLPLKPEHKVFVVQFAGSAMTPVEDKGRTVTVLGKALERGPARVQEQIRSLDPAGHEYKQLLMASGSANFIIAVTRRASQHPLQAQAVRDLTLSGKPLIVVAAREPYDADVAPSESAIIASYGDDDATMEAVADVLLGRAVCRGRLPVRLRKSQDPAIPVP